MQHNVSGSRIMSTVLKMLGNLLLPLLQNMSRVSKFEFWHFRICSHLTNCSFTCAVHFSAHCLADSMIFSIHAQHLVTCARNTIINAMRAIGHDANKACLLPRLKIPHSALPYSLTEKSLSVQ